MNIDWSKAPEDATHVGTKKVPGVTCWYKLKEGVFYFWYCTNDDLDFDGWAESKGDPIHTPLIERPKKQEAWDGGGDDLPPIGTVCEHAAADNKLDAEEGQWFKVEIIAHHKFNNDEYKCAVWVSGSEISYSSSGSHFRPIKTAEQLAEEDREKVIQDMLEVTSDGITCIDRYDAEQLYKAGYRKQ